MGYASAPEDLALHGVRVFGFPTAERIALRYGLDAAEVEELLLDVEAVGWTRRSSFGGSSGWSLTPLGKAEGERRVAAELERSGARDVVEAVHRDFLPVNRSFGDACTRWQIRPTPREPLAPNDHTDRVWDHNVLSQLRTLGARFTSFAERIAAHLDRFGGYPDAYAAALAYVERGEHAWVDAPDRDSLHLVWIQFHEDLVATLGIERGAQG